MVSKNNDSVRVRDELLNALERVDRPGAVCVSGDQPLVMPGLEVEGVGAIGLPLGKTQAKKLIRQCSQAPYGKGTETLVDTNVRRVWELDPERFILANPDWEDVVSSITQVVQAGLGLEDRKLKTHLYKLLVYEKGSFFLPHRDGEKLDGMVATLVISLPSVHSGGELVVTHEGQRQEIAFRGAASGYELSYAAFYADCEHEVLPVREGYRLSLVYNLTLAKSRRKTSVGALRTRAVVETLGDLFREWAAKDQGTEEKTSKLAITLEHQYSQNGLTIDRLKGIDRARADVLFAAAELADCAAYLALVTHWESGYSEGDYYGARFHENWDYNEGEHLDGQAGYRMIEVYDGGLFINHWSDPQGQTVALGRMDLREDEIVSNRPTGEWNLSGEDYEGYTGNEGMTLERWYRRAAIIIWPRRNHFHVLCAAGTDAAIAGLEAMVKSWKRAAKSKKASQREACLEFAKTILDTWAPIRFSFHSFDNEETVDRAIVPQLLQELDDSDLIGQFLTQVFPKEARIELDNNFPKFCKRHGWPKFAKALTHVLDATSARTLSRNIALMELLCVTRDKNSERMELCQQLADHAVLALERFEKKSPVYDWELREIDWAALLISLVRSFLSVEADDSLKRLLDYTLSHTKRYDLTEVHLKAIFTLEPWLNRKLQEPHPIITGWLNHCRNELEKRTKKSPALPTDLRRSARLSCNCELCQELKTFLADPEESVHHFRVRKDLRAHLHQIIDRHRCDLTHVTSRTGSPYTLVCTKTTASYDRACTTYTQDQENLKRLQRVEKKLCE